MKHAKCIVMSAFLLFSTAHAATENSELNSSGETQEQKLRNAYQEKQQALIPRNSLKDNTSTSNGNIQDFPVTTDDAPDMSDADNSSK